MNRKRILLCAVGTLRFDAISMVALGISAGAALKPVTAHGQVFVTNNGNGTIGEYTTSGTTVNASLISALSYPVGIAVSGSDLFITNNGTIGEYTTSGATVNASLVTGLNGLVGIAVSGSDLFVVNNITNTIGEYTTSGATVNTSLVTGLNGPSGIAVSGSDLFVTNNNSNTIGEYTTSGATVNASLVSGLNGPIGIAVSGSDLFVANNGTIGEYTTSGATVNTSLVTGLNGPFGIALSGSDLFVTNSGSGTIGEYTTSGATVNASLVSGLNVPVGIAALPADLTWNNAGGSGDGMEWDTTSQNWNDGSNATVYVDGSNVTFNDNNNGNYAVTLNTTVSPGSVTVNNSSGDYIISGTGSIAGTGSLTKTGSGTLTLSIINTSSGGTIVNAGTLVVSNTTGSATGPGNVTLNGGVFASGITGSISGNVLAGTGAHTIAPGGVGTIGSLSVGGLTSTSLTTLNFDLGTGTGIVTNGDLLTLGSGAVSIGSGTLMTFGGTSTLGNDYRLIGGSVSGINLAAFTLPSAPSGQVYSLSNTVDNGYIDLVVGAANLIWNNTGGSGDGMQWETASQNWNDGSAPALYTEGSNVTFNDTNNGHYAVTLNTVVSPNSVTFNNSSGDYTISGTGGIGGNGSLTKSGSRTLTLNTINTYTGGTIVNAGTLVVNNTTGSATGSGDVTLNGGFFASGTTGSIAGNVLAGTGSHTIAPGGVGTVGSLTIGGLTSTALTTVTFDLGTGMGEITNGDLLTLGSGTVNIGSGTVMTFGGVPVANDDYRLIGDMNSGTVVDAIPLANFSLPSAPAGLRYSLSNTVDNGYIDLVVGAVNLTWNNTGGSGDGMQWDTTSQNWNDGSNATVYVDGSNVTFNDNNNGNYAVTLNTTVSPGSVTVNNSSGDYIISGTGGIAGTASLTKTGSGTLTLSTINTYSGGTIINAGVLNFSNLNNLGSGTVIFGGGTLQYATGATADISTLSILLGVGGGTIDTNGNNVTLSNSIGDNGAGGLTKAGAGDLILNALATYSGNTVVNAGTLEIGPIGGIAAANISVSFGAILAVDAGGAISASTNLTDNGTYIENNSTRTINSLEGSGMVTLNGATLTVSNGGSFSGKIADGAANGSLVLPGGTLTLSGTNTYSGGTTVSGGTLQTGSTNALGTGPLAIASPGVLDLDGNSPTIFNLSGSGTVDNVSAGGTVTLAINTSTNSSFAGTIRNTTGAVAVTVSGTGTQTLSGANNYSGGTIVNAGTLVVNNTTGSALGPGNVTLNGGIFASGITGSISGNVLAGTGAHTIAPGGVGTIGSLSVGGLTSTSLTTLNFDLGTGTGIVTNGDLLTLGSGAVSIGSGTLMTFGGTSTLGNDYRLIGGSVSGINFAAFTLPSAPSGQVYSLSNTVDNGYIDLVVGAANLIWNNTGGSGDGMQWETASQNWNDGSAPALYTEGSNVTFNDTNNGHYAVTLNTVVSPNSVTFNNSSGDYTISGTGGIGGNGSLTKSGSRTLTLNTINTYTGGTIVNAGTLVIGVNGALLNGDVTINGGTLNQAGGSISAGNLNVGSTSGSVTYNYTSGSFSAGTINAENCLFKANQGGTLTCTTANFDGGAIVSLDGGATLSANQVTLQGGNVIVGNATISSSGTISNGAGSQLQLVNPGSSVIQISGALSNFGLIYGSGQVTGAIQNNSIGEISVGSGQSMTIAGATNANGGLISLAGGMLHFTGTLSNNSNGIIEGAGALRVDGGLANNGTLGLAGSSSVFGPVTNAASATIHLSGNSPNVFFGGVSNSGLVTIDAGASGTFYGEYTGSGAIMDNGSLYLNANSVAGPITGNGNLTIGSDSSGPAVLQLIASSGPSSQEALKLTAGSTLDLTNNHIFINYGSGPDPIASIAAMIASGYAGGTWSGSGITSSLAQTNSASYGIGYADSADPGNPAGLASGQIEIKYTLLGDANLDGAVNGTDFAILASNFNKAVTGWDQGDFNYDGAANGADFASLAANFNKGASQSADTQAFDSFAAANGLTADVPEPASMVLMVMAGLGTLQRRQRYSRWAARKTAAVGRT